MNKLEITRFPPLEYAAAEAVNTLCTNLSFAGEDVKRIMITSSQASEGKSFLSMNIMRTMAELGKSVALVDADLRRSMITPQYGLRFSNEEVFGLTHYLAGMCKIDDIIYETDIEGAYMVPVGRDVTYSLSLLNTPRFSFLLRKLTAQVDFVLVDAPPVGIIIDAAEIAKSCDGTLLVVNYGRVSRRELLGVKHQLAQTGCRILGTVLNGVEFSSYTSRKYYNKSYYSHYNSDYYRPAKRGKSKKEPAAEKQR